ncbi:MAG: hypothetical protein ACXVDA_26060, partial [Ktedonobacterales bacterium]
EDGDEAASQTARAGAGEIDVSALTAVEEGASAAASGQIEMRSASLWPSKMGNEFVLVKRFLLTDSDCSMPPFWKVQAGMEARG